MAEILSPLAGNTDSPNGIFLYFAADLPILTLLE